MSVSYIARRASQEALRQMSFVFNTIFLVSGQNRISYNCFTEQNKHSSLFFKIQQFIGFCKKSCIRSELPEFIIHFFKEITFDIYKEGRVCRFFHCYGN